MKQIRTIIYLIFQGLSLTMGVLHTSCTRTIELEPLSEPMMAMKAWWFPDKEMTLELSNTISFNDTENEIRFLEEATVDIFEDGNNLGRMMVDTTPWFPEHEFILPGVFPKPGSNYIVKASAPGYPSISAELDVPEIPQIAAFRFIERELVDRGLGDSLYHRQTARAVFEVDIVDEPGIENFYELGVEVSSVENGVLLNGGTNVLELADPLLLDDANLITDETFDGKTVTIRFSANTYYWTNEATIRIGVTNLPVEYALYRRNNFSFQNTDNPFIEPVSEFSNVIGGVGTLFCFPSATDSTIVQP